MLFSVLLQKHGAAKIVCSSANQKPERKVSAVVSKKQRLEKEVKDLRMEMKRAWEDVKEICKEPGYSHACVSSWDRYWEIEQAYYEKNEVLSEYVADPLIEYCENKPWCDECKVYDI
jgi:hypothetical protein